MVRLQRILTILVVTLFCKDCIVSHLSRPASVVDEKKGKCPTIKQLIPDITLRKKIASFKVCCKYEEKGCRVVSMIGDGVGKRGVDYIAHYLAWLAEG